MEASSFSSSSSSSSSSCSSSFSSSIFSSSSFVGNSSLSERPVGDRKKAATMRFFCDGAAHHFLDACFLCKRPIAVGRDIFMYRGNTPFCSDECREEQIEMDEALEREERRHRRCSSSSSKSLVKNCAVNKSSGEEHSNGGVIRIHRRPTIINFTPLVAG